MMLITNKQWFYLLSGFWGCYRLTLIETFNKSIRKYETLPRILIVVKRLLQFVFSLYHYYTLNSFAHFTT